MKLKATASFPIIAGEEEVCLEQKFWRDVKYITLTYKKAGTIRKADNLATERPLEVFRCFGTWETRPEGLVIYEEKVLRHEVTHDCILHNAKGIYC